MVYTMLWKVDGGCRRNGYSDSIGAAAAVMVLRSGKQNGWRQQLPSYPTPTNQRAEISAIIMALERTLQIYDGLDTNPYLELTIQSDSRYAVGCMTQWIYKWCYNGWTNAAGQEVANRDLIEEASDLHDRVKELGTVKYEWIPRADNAFADQLCNESLDEQE